MLPPAFQATSVPPFLRHKTLIWVAFLSLIGCFNQGADATKPFALPHFDISLTIPKGWLEDKSIQYNDPAKAGTFFQLIRESAVRGSPRITGEISPLALKPLTLIEAKRDALQTLQTLKSQENISIEFTQTRETQLLGQPAIELSHSYTLGKGNNQLSVTQIEIISIYKGRALSFTAAGRTELFTPLQAEIKGILESGTFVTDPEVP